MARKATKKRQELAGTRVKIKFKNHIMPPMVGLIMAFAIFGFFNSELISGKIAYYLYSGKTNVAAIDAVTAKQTINKNAPAEIIINKIKVKAPVIYDQTTVNEANFLKALQNGVVHYPNTAVPGQTGNTVIFGHSSGLWWAPGNYKFVFTLLDKLNNGDKIFIDYQGVRYTYKVTNKTVVLPTDLSVLNQTSDNRLTLITCTPVGTSAKRLIVTAEQIAPRPITQTTANQATSSQTSPTVTLPGNSPSFWQDLRNIF